MGLYRTLSHRHAAVGGVLVGRLTEGEVDLVRTTLCRRFEHDWTWGAEDGALLLLGGAIAMREDGARASWDTIAGWLGIGRPGPVLEQRARHAMSQAEDLYGRPLCRGADRRCLYIGTMFRDSGQLWRLLLHTLERLGNAEACWGPRRAWTEEDWLGELRPELSVHDAEVRATLAERLVELCEGRGLLADLQLIHPSVEDTWTSVESAGVDLREVLGVQSEDEARVLLPRLFRFRMGRAENRATDAHSDIARWAVVRCSDGRLVVALRLAECVPAEAIASDDREVRLSDPSRPRWNDLGERADIVATYSRQGDGWELSGTSTWTEISTQGLRIAARRNERSFPIPDFPRWGLLVRDTGESDILPALATPRPGEVCVLVTAPDAEVEGLGVHPESLKGGWVARRFRATPALTYTVTSEGLSLTVACGRAPLPCPLQIEGRAPEDVRGGGGLGRLEIGGRTVFVGMPRIAARSAAVRRSDPVVRLAGPDGERAVAARWHRGTLQFDAAGPGAWTLEEPEGRWRARFYVLATDQVPSFAWTTAGVKLALSEDAGWTCGCRFARGTGFYAPLPTDDAGPTVVRAVVPGKPEYQWSFDGRAAEIALLDAAGSLRDSLTISRSELARGDKLRLRGPAGARVDVRVNGESVAERILPLNGELVERSGLLFRQLISDEGDVDVSLSIVGTEAARRFTLFDDGTADRPVGTPRNLEFTQDEEGVRRLRLDADVTLERPRVGIVRLGAEFPWVGWEGCEWRNEYRSAPLALPPGPYAVVLRGDRRLPNGGLAQDAQTHAVRLVVPGPPPVMNLAALAERLKAQECDGLDLSAARRTLAEVAGDLRQLAHVARLLDGPVRAELARDLAALPAAAPRLAWWVARARARIDEDPRIDGEVVDALERLLVDVGWHPSWIRYSALMLLLPPWPRGGWPQWEEGGRDAARRIAEIYPNLATPLQSLLRREVAVHLVQNDARWPRASAMEPPALPSGRPVNVELPPDWNRRARGWLADQRRLPRLSFLEPGFSAAESIQVGADVLLARKVLLEAITLRDMPARPSALEIGRLADLLRWTVRIEQEPALAARTREWERSLLPRFPLTMFGS